MKNCHSLMKWKAWYVCIYFFRGLSDAMFIT